jgi:hypothetical protein
LATSAEQYDGAGVLRYIFISMLEQKVITGSNEQEVWAQITHDLTTDNDMLTYDVLINQAGRQIALNIDIDLGGGFEGGSETTMISAPLAVNRNFRFALHDEDFLDSIGKFFGLEDVVLGYPELDEHVVVKTNARQKVSELFADPALRSVFTHLTDFNFGIHMRTVDGMDAEQPFLEFNSNLAITEPDALQQIYHAFCSVLTGLEN